LLGTQDALPLHLREARDVADPRESSSDEFLRTLLAPARSGLILVREDIARAARDLRTGVRAGERAFALRSLMGQSHHKRRRETHGRVAEWWAARARSTAKLLRELRDAAADDALKSVSLDESEEKAHS
jgi:hypothetical protein